MKDIFKQLKQVEKYIKTSERSALKATRKYRKKRITTLVRADCKRCEKVRAEARLNKLTMSRLMDDIIDFYFSNVQKK